jgi:hypothetical protein
MNFTGCNTEDASCQFTYRFVTTAVGTITNTVTAHFHPDGFANDIMDDGTCTADVVGGEGCTPGFFKRWTNVWDEASDPISVAVQAAVDAKGAPYVYVAGQGVTTQLFKNIFGLSDAQMTAAGLATHLTMEQADQSPRWRFQQACPPRCRRSPELGVPCLHVQC